MSRFFKNFRQTPPGIQARLTRPVPWRPMDDEEWEAIMHFMVFVHPGPGRPTIHGARRALDACFHAACFAGPWKKLPAAFGKPDSIHRLFRRWTHAGLWKMMLKFVAKERPGLQAIQYWVCRAFRRAWRIQGLAGLSLARRLGLDSALRAPSWYLPDADLSAFLHSRILPRAEAAMQGQNTRIQRQWLDLLLRLHSQCIGRRTLPRHLHLTHQETLWPERFGPVLAPPSPPWHAPAMVAFPS
jgi:transposase